MRTITLLLLTFIASVLMAQERFSLGIQAEGIQSRPENPAYYSAQLDKEFGGGAGVYFTANLWKSISANTGINYRFIQYDNYSKYVGQEPGENKLEGNEYNQNYLVVPVNIRGSFLNNWLFFEPGIESTWILGNDSKDPKFELLWKIGAGSKVGKLNYSLNYLWGTQDQIDVIKTDPLQLTVYQSRLLQLKVSYPLWSK